MSIMPPPDEPIIRFYDIDALDSEIRKLTIENEFLNKKVEELIKERDELKADLMLWKAEFHVMNPRSRM